ncbi:hypothetical protein Tco_0485603 [Tanacetum coccineum]
MWKPRESRAQRKLHYIRPRIPPRRSTRLTPPTPILTVAEAEDITLQEIIQLSIVEQKSRDDLEAKQNEEKVKEHLMAEEIEKLVEGTENVENNEVVNYVINNQEVPGTRSRVKELTKTQVPIYVAHGLIMERQQSQADVAKRTSCIPQERGESS